MDDELDELLERALALEVPGERGRLVGALDRAQGEVHRAAARRHGDVAPQVGLEALLQPGSQRQQRRLPLPAVVDAGQAAVMQLVAEVEGELVVLVALGGRRGGQASDGSGQRVEQQLGDGAAGLGEGQHS